MFLKILQNSQENTCAGVPLLKACNFIKKETATQLFSCEIYATFKNTFFTEEFRCLLLYIVFINFLGMVVANTPKTSKIHESFLSFIYFYMEVFENKYSKKNFLKIPAYFIKPDSHLPKIFFLFASRIALQKWWKMMKNPSKMMKNAEKSFKNDEKW